MGIDAKFGRLFIAFRVSWKEREHEDKPEPPRPKIAVGFQPNPPRTEVTA